MDDRFQYLLLMAACVAITLPLEFVLRARVYRRPVRLALALLPTVARTSHAPGALAQLARGWPAGTFVAEVGVGVVHHATARPSDDVVDPAVRTLHARIKQRFDPSGRLNPGVDVLAAR